MNNETALSTDRAVEAVRHFNRFYTRQIGVLQEGLLHSPYSLSEVRIMFELAHREQPSATELARELGLDAGYLSRILRSFEDRGLIVKKPSSDDGRQTLLQLSRKGRAVFGPLDARSNTQVASLLGDLSPLQQKRLLEAMHVIEELLQPPAEPKLSFLLRAHQPGDMGWVVHRHGVVYAQEYGWDERFEALVAEIVAKFIQNFDPKCERCWIAERDGEIAGSVFLVKHARGVAKLRLLLVEPWARGLGIGKRLVDECIRFTRQSGYRKISLWTQNNLAAARQIYKQAGFTIVESQPNHSFGHDLISETWELHL
jgi:DNA-binding MarR family transcriptional regulator/N-acetylglutamate synthase-like GNAT family acetyltransferase